MSKQDHRVSVDSGKYTFVIPADDWSISILRYGEPWHGPQGEASNALHAMMYELDAARVVVQAARECIGDLGALCPGSIRNAMNLHDSLVSDRTPPSAWCGTEAAPAAGPEKCPRCRFTPCRKMFQCREPDPDDIERRRLGSLLYEELCDVLGDAQAERIERIVNRIQEAK